MNVHSRLLTIVAQLCRRPFGPTGSRPFGVSRPDLAGALKRPCGSRRATRRKKKPATPCQATMTAAILTLDLRRALRRSRARPCPARISQQSRSRAGRAGRRGDAARAAPDLLRQLRLAFLRPQPLAAGAIVAPLSGHESQRRYSRVV